MNRIDIKNKTIPASTLLEVVIAMVILVSVYGASLLIIANTGKSNSRIKLMAFTLMQNEINKTKADNTYLDEEIEEGRMKIVKEFEKFSGSENLIIMKVGVYTLKDKLLVERKELVLQ